nr:zinc finger, CCHC-type [Tanacetum cinerariifolium]
MFTQHENKGKYFRGRGPGKYKFSQGRNHENFKEERKDKETSHRSYNKNNIKKSSYDTSKLQCYKCKKIGHIAPKCPQKTKPNEQYNLVEEDLEPTLLMAILEDGEEQEVSLHEKDVGYKETNMDSLWYLDNGASNHMTRVREHFKELDEERNQLYKANLRIGTPVCLLANLKEDTRLWHARLGHLNFESLKSMAQRDLVQGIPAIKHTTQVCDVFLIGKHSRVPFPKKAKARSTSPLDLVYGDLCGPITPPTPSGKKYIFLLVDDYSRYIWVYFLTTKDQAFDTFKEYKNSIENELRTTLKMLRTDRGGEFTSSEFTQYYKENGIARQLTAPYSPQQNGVVERRNRTIMSTTRLRGFRTLNDSYENTEELLLAKDEPRNYKEPSSDQKWIEAMKVELDSINRNNTWELTTLPKGHKAIGLKWVFKTKKDANGNIIKHKARLVAKGYIQQHGIDFEEVFAPVARMETVRLLLAIAASNKWEVHHLDVKSAFLHGDLKEEVYVTQPEGFIKRQDNGKVYRLIKALYGLR